MTHAKDSELLIAAPPSTCTLHRGDCFEIMPTLPADSIHLIFADVPYALANKQVTANIWDTPFDIRSFWPLAQKLLLKNGVITMTAKQHLASLLLVTNFANFRYDLIWDKVRPSRHLHAKRMPLLRHESILVFYKPPCTYNPIMEQRAVATKRGGTNVQSKNASTPNFSKIDKNHIYTEKYPTSIISTQREHYTVHPTQKPVALLEWLITTYTNPGDTVLDPVSGSATTAVACARLGRNFVGIEKDAEYFSIGRDRVDAERKKLGLQPCEAKT